MSPDSVESRLAALVQRVNDLVESVADRFKHSDEAVERRFAALDAHVAALPTLVREIDKLAAEQAQFRERQQGIELKIDAVHTRLDRADQKELEDAKAQETSRLAEKRADRRVRLTLIGMAILGIMSSAVTIVLAVTSG